MTSILSSVISHADKIPVVGNVASTWLPSSSGTSPKTVNDKKRPSFTTPPPPYCEATAAIPSSSSKLSQLSSFMWRQGTQLLPDITASNTMTQTTIDKKQVEQVVALIHIAGEMDQSGNHQMAVDLYVMGIDRLLSALPLDSDPTLKLAVEHRLSEFRDRKKLNLDQPFQEMMMAVADCQEIMDEEQDASKATITFKSRLTNMVTSVASYGVDVIKNSPIPDAVSYSMTCALAGLEAVDATCQLRQRTWNLAVQGVAKAMEMDRRYEVHRLVLEKLLVTCNALLQAAVAQSEPPK